MILYDLLAEGFHTPLTREEIADLHQAGRITRDTPCKLAVKLEWRTVDELFPLLKHNSAPDDALLEYLEGPRQNRSFVGVGLIAVFLLVAAAAFGWARYLDPDPIPQTTPQTSTRSRATTGAFVNTAAPKTYGLTAPRPRATPRIQTARTAPPVARNPLRRGTPPQAQPRPTADVSAHYARLERDRAAREQLQREQAANAERIRQENERREADRIRVAGTDTIVPLDTDSPVNVAGQLVKVKVHDNDVVSIDVWVDGRWFRDLKKQKGITQSGTDETLIFTNGRAALYYVWELSGKLNHCRLRVREG